MLHASSYPQHARVSVDPHQHQRLRSGCEGVLCSNDLVGHPMESQMCETPIRITTPWQQVARVECIERLMQPTTTDLLHRNLRPLSQSMRRTNKQKANGRNTFMGRKFIATDGLYKTLNAQRTSSSFTPRVQRELPHQNLVTPGLARHWALG